MPNDIIKPTLGSDVAPAVDPIVEVPAGSKAFTQEEMDAIISKRLAKEREANEKRIQEALAEERRQAQLTQEQRDKELEERRKAELREREEKITLRERRIEAQELLVKNNVPMDLVDFVVDLDKTVMEAKITKLANTYSQSVMTGVESKLKGSTPTDFNKTPTGTEKKISKAF